MEAKSEKIDMDFQEWANLFANKKDCFGFCMNTLQSLVDDSREYIEEVEQYFAKTPEVMALLKVKVELNIETLFGRVVCFNEKLEEMKEKEK